MATASKQKDRYRLFEVKPSVSGALVTRGSADNAGVFNYTVKRDFRRDLDIERRREGYDYFYPNTNLSIGGQPFPSQVQLDSLSYAAGTVTATRLQGHYFQNGETILITGADDANYNGAFQIFNVTDRTFQYSISGVPVSPDTSTAIFAAAVETISYLGSFERPNGQSAVIAASKRRIYRYYALDDPDYISRDPKDYPAGTPASQLSYWSDGTLFPADAAAYPVGTPTSQQQYVDTNPGYWVVVGWGFSPAGNRWEAVPINGYLIMNNGVDLMITYRVEDAFVKPIYQLREQGIAAVNTIWEAPGGILMGGDVAEITPAHLADWFNLNHRVVLDSLTSDGAGVATATVAAGHPYQVRDLVTVYEATGPAFNGIHEVIAVTATTFQFRIVGTPVTPDPSILIYVTGDPYGLYDDAQYLDRTQYRVIWATPDEPRLWAPVYLGTIHQGSNSLLLQFPVKGIDRGTNLTVTGAGAAHAGGTADNLSGNVISISGRSVVLDTFAQTDVTGANVQDTAQIGSVVGQEDLQGDGSAVLKGLVLADQVVIYKATSIFLAQYLGTPAQPFAFVERQPNKGECLFYRHTLILAQTPNETFHLYAGQTGFYRFDLTNQQPMLLPHFESCSDVFFSQASLTNTESIFSCQNDITNEILIVFPSASAEKALIWDYKQDTISTTAVVITAGASIAKPIAGPLFQAETWFIMGNNSSTVTIYGKTTLNQNMPGWGNSTQIFYQRGQFPYNATRIGYPSVMTWGLGNFGSNYLEKDLRAVVALLGSHSPDTPFSVSLYQTQNANRPITLLGTKSLPDPITQNLVPCAFRGIYFQASMTVTGIDNPFEYVGLDWDVAPVASRSITRA